MSYKKYCLASICRARPNNSKKSYKFSKVKPKPPRTPKVRPSPTFNSTIRVALLDYIINQ